MAHLDLSGPEADAVRSYIDVLKQCVGEKLVDAFVFGSKARGEAGLDSDIDLMIILDHPTAQELSEARGLAFDIWLAHGVFLSIRAMSTQQWKGLAAMRSLFYRNAMKDAVPLLPSPSGSSPA